MQKLFNFLMVGLTFAVLNVGTVEAADCSEFTPGTPSFQSCVAQNEMSAEENQSGGGAGAGALENAAIPSGNPVDAEIVDRLGGGNATAARAIDDKVDADAAAALAASIATCLAEHAGNTEEYCRGTFNP